ncbi:MAG: hypothetical protein FVQ81_05130 [Candidatus Glassbacteria bacterium]|nr:hypothetical protein [Candidatus Glassbacteria bacterium]
MSSLFEENEQILDELEQAEYRLEKIRIDGPAKTDGDEKSELAATLKTLVVRLVENIAKSGGKMDEFGGAVVLVDLADVLERYGEIFKIPGLEKKLAELRTMMDQAGG